MKTEEDEAFDDLARKQGDWGGGYQAKRKMAADKLQEPPSEWAGIKAILDEYGLQSVDFVADFKAALAQPAQEPTGMLHITRLDKWLDASLKKRKQREWVGLTDEDIEIAFDNTRECNDPREFAYAVEAKLKEKNG